MPLVECKFCKYIYPQSKLVSHQKQDKFCLEIQGKYFKCKVCSTVSKDSSYHYIHQENCMLKLECSRLKNKSYNNILKS
jgi:rubredoxin